MIKKSTDAKECFIRSTESLGMIEGVHNYLKGQTPAYDLSELLRAEYILWVSALDLYIHNIVLELVMFAYQSNNQEILRKSAKNCKLSIPLDRVSLFMQERDLEELGKLIKEEVKKIIFTQTYQAPDEIARVLNGVGIKSLWNRIAEKRSTEAESLKKKLQLVVSRRNQIAHESDVSRTNGEKQNINRETVLNCKKVVLSIVEEIEILAQEILI